MSLSSPCTPPPPLVSPSLPRKGELSAARSTSSFSLTSYRPHSPLTLQVKHLYFSLCRRLFFYYYYWIYIKRKDQPGQCCLPIFQVSLLICHGLNVHIWTIRSPLSVCWVTTLTHNLIIACSFHIKMKGRGGGVWHRSNMRFPDEGQSHSFKVLQTISLDFTALSSWLGEWIIKSY